MTEKEIENMLKDYHWMNKEIHRLYETLYGRGVAYSHIRYKGVAKYGIDSVMPTGSAGKSQAELKDMDLREERNYKRLIKFVERVKVIETTAQEILATL
ncbi:hypothetical protein ACSVDA_24600 [Cytobacillus sp. Hm23]